MLLPRQSAGLVRWTVRAPPAEGEDAESSDTGMLRVPTFVAPSAIAGVGLFTSVDLRRGAVIWEFTEGVDWVLSALELEAFPEPYRSRIRHYVYEERPGVFVLCGDNAKFMNHASDPNCEDPDGPVTLARRAIRAGEELTCDYRSFDLGSRLPGGLSFPTAHGHPTAASVPRRRSRDNGKMQLP